MVGKDAPDFVLKSLDGTNLRLSEFRGQVVLLNFWARWANDSRREMPALNRINITYARAGLVVLGISVDDDLRRAQEFADSMKVSYPVMLDTGSQIWPGLRARPVAHDHSGRSLRCGALFPSRVQAWRRSPVPRSHTRVASRVRLAMNCKSRSVSIFAAALWLACICGAMPAAAARVDAAPARRPGAGRRLPTAAASAEPAASAPPTGAPPAGAPTAGAPPAGDAAPPRRCRRPRRRLLNRATSRRSIRKSRA